MTENKMNIQVSLDTYEMDQNLLDSIPATFYRMIHLGALTYAVFKQGQTFTILKCVDQDGQPELHDIESEAEFEFVREHFLELEERPLR